MKVIAKIRAFFLKQEGSKEVLNRVKFFAALFVILGIGVFVILFSNSSSDRSVVINANAPLVTDSLDEAKVSSPISQKVSDLLKASEQRKVRDVKPKQAKSAPKQKLIYKAVQVIERGDDDSSTGKLLLGTNLIGKLLTSIDTRESEQLYKVLLPYGGKGSDGLPKNSILFGTITYPNKGKKVFMKFNKALLPDGREVELKAQVLNAKDYSSGLEGKLHSGAAGRIAATLGLTMVSAFTDTLTEKQALGEGHITVKSTAKNSLYQGIAKASEVEAGRQAANIGNAQAYVTIPAGRELIINLLDAGKL